MEGPNSIKIAIFARRRKIGCPEAICVGHLSLKSQKTQLEPLSVLKRRRHPTSSKMPEHFSIIISG